MTTIYNIRNNLLQTIAGKEHHLADLRYQSTLMAQTEEIVAKTTIKFLEINIDELKRILADVDVCCEQASARAWQGYLDRQNGI